MILTKIKDIFNHIYNNHINKIIWFILGLQALIVSITSYK